MHDRSHPLRVLHVVERMVRGGVETWLTHMLRTMDRKEVHNDVLVHLREPGEYDEEITALGAKIFICPHDGNPIVYAVRLAKILRQNPYDVVHSHLHHFSGLVLLIARLSGVSVRIAHSHTDTTVVDAGASFDRRLYMRLMKWLIDRWATAGIAVSANAASALRNGVSCQLKWQIVPCGIDLSPFALLLDKSPQRQRLCIPDAAMVVAHVGNFTAAKNHRFLLQVFAELIKIKPDSYLLLVGDGDLRGETEALAASLAIAGQVRFLGRRADVPAILAAADVFLFPSAFEGLGLAAIEAQASGLPVIIADTVPAEVEAVPGLLSWLSLSQPPAVWAKACLQAHEEQAPPPQAECLRTIGGTMFNILNNICAIEAIYRHKTGLNQVSPVSHSGR